MNGKPRTRKDLFTFASRRRGTKISASRWQIVLIALLLVVAVGSAGQMTGAQAAPAGATELSFFMIANKEGAASTAVCVGELVTVQVLVYRRKLINGVDNGIDTLTGISVIGVVDTPNIGRLSPTENTTIWASSIYPGAADFVFYAEKPGETIVAFSTTIITGGWFGTSAGGVSQIVSAQFSVRVIPCKYKVETIGKWFSASDGAYFSVTAMSDKAVITADADGHYTGSANMNWAGTGMTGNGCPISVQLASGQVHYTGESSESGQLTLDQTYEPVQGSDSYDCGGERGWAKGLVSADPLSLSIPASGGVLSISNHLLTIPWWVPTYGSVTMVVIPEEDKSVSFNQHNPAASIGSPSTWMAELWDAFPWLNDARLGRYP